MIDYKFLKLDFKLECFNIKIDFKKLIIENLSKKIKL